MWQVEITDIAKVLNDGTFNITYRILVDGGIAYDNQVVNTTTTTQALQKVTAQVNAIKAATLNAASLHIGQKITI